MLQAQQKGCPAGRRKKKKAEEMVEIEEEAAAQEELAFYALIQKSCSVERANRSKLFHGTPVFSIYLVFVQKTPSPKTRRTHAGTTEKVGNSVWGCLTRVCVFVSENAAKRVLKFLRPPLFSPNFLLMVPPFCSRLFLHLAQNLKNFQKLQLEL